MITNQEFVTFVFSFLNSNKHNYNPFFSKIVSILYLNSLNFLRIDYCNYYNARIRKIISKIRNKTDIDSIIRLDKLCTKIYNYSLNYMGPILEIDNIPNKRRDGNFIDYPDLLNTFSLMGNIDLLERVGPNTYILSYKDKDTNKIVKNLLDEKILEDNLLIVQLIGTY